MERGLEGGLSLGWGYHVQWLAVNSDGQARARLRLQRWKGKGTGCTLLFRWNAIAAFEPRGHPASFYANQLRLQPQPQLQLRLQLQLQPQPQPQLLLLQVKRLETRTRTKHKDCWQWLSAR